MFLRCLGGFLVDIWNYLGSRSAFSGVFTHFFGPEGVQKQGASRGPGLPGDSQGIIFDLKTPKKTPKRAINVFKTGRNGLAGHFWGIFVPRQA